MMNMKNMYNKILIVSGLLAIFSSCSFLDVEPKIIRTETFYKNEGEVRNGLAGVYSALNNEAFYGNYYSLMASNIDDLCYFNRDVNTNFLQYNIHTASTQQIYSMWTEIYRGVKNANTYLAAVKDSEFDKDGLYYNEARFLRAYYYFILAQAWGNVPLITEPYYSTSENLKIASTPQFDVLKWVVQEMDECRELAVVELDNSPSRVTKSTMEGILARVYLFMAGATVDRGENSDELKVEYLTKARDFACLVIDSERHFLNPDYAQIFKNMITDTYDTEYRESMWEVDFLGDRSSAEKWSNGRIGDILGLQSSGSENYESFNCNYAYGQYNGSLKLWNLYWVEDRVDTSVQDARQDWNLPPYNYAGNKNKAPYDSGLDAGESLASIHKTPYVYNGRSTTTDPKAAPAIRNCGKFRREVEYEGHKSSKVLYTTINFPILRYSDILLMYAEASNELDGPTQAAYDCVVAVRERAGVATKEFTSYDQTSFRQLIRNERGRELCFEALRKYDLIRWGLYVEEMNNYRSWVIDDNWSKNTALAERAGTMGLNVKQRHIVLPVPSIELGVNSLLKQHPLW